MAAAQCVGASATEEQDAVWSTLQMLASAPTTSLPFRVSAAPSRIPDAGTGVFIQGSAAAGSVVAVYRGTVYQLDDMTAMYGLICPGNDYLMFRRDGILVDGRDTGPSRALFDSALLREAAAARISPSEAARRAWEHPFALGQLVNHPPPGVQPNVYAFPLDVPNTASAAVKDWFAWINVPFREAGDRTLSSGGNDLGRLLFQLGINGQASSNAGPFVRTVVIRALRPLRDEELFLDYKLQSDSPPKWYHRTG